MSGAQKRKRAVEEKAIRMKLPKLTSSLNTGAAQATAYWYCSSKYSINAYV